MKCGYQLKYDNLMIHTFFVEMPGLWVLLKYRGPVIHTFLLQMLRNVGICLIPSICLPKIQTKSVWKTIVSSFPHASFYFSFCCFCQMVITRRCGRILTPKTCSLAFQPGTQKSRFQRSALQADLTMNSGSYIAA